MKKPWETLDVKRDRYMAGIVNNFPRFFLSFVSHLCRGTIHSIRWIFGLTKLDCSLPCSEDKCLREIFGYVRPECWWVLEKMEENSSIF